MHNGVVSASSGSRVSRSGVAFIQEMCHKSQYLGYNEVLYATRADSWSALRIRCDCAECAVAVLIDTVFSASSAAASGLTSPFRPSYRSAR